MSAPPVTRSRQGSLPPALRTARGWITAGITIAIALVLLVPIGAVMQIVFTAQFDDRTPTQAIILMDPTRVWGDDPAVLSSRADQAAELYQSGVAPVIMLTGRARTSEQVRALLRARSVPDQDIVSFTTTIDTLGSLQMIAAVMNDLGWSSATIVTDPPNAARASAIASGFGIDAHLSPAESGPGSAMTSDYVGRETAALMRYYLISRWTQPQLVKAGA
ncbi:MAG: YdcF family protein [Actinomycetota bacterium]|nr:YdcF family protein [Actinomycetota bacterium]MDP2289507.1 YdcF family protein [Actinomycetota bacterium]